MFSGCGGNENRFRTEESCISHCVCHIPPEAGPCRSSIEKYFYNPTTGCCEKFTYGGCQGNSNNFQTYEECRASCVGSAPGMVKPRGSNWGSGSVIQFETNNFYNPMRTGNMFSGSKSVWLHGDRMSVMGGTPQANKIINYISPNINKKDHWHFVAKQGGTKEIFPQQLGGTLKLTGISSSSQMQPVGGSRMVLTGSRSVPMGGSGGQLSAVIGGSSGGSFSEGVPMGGSKLVMSGGRSVPMGSVGSSSGKFSQMFGTSGGGLTGGGGLGGSSFRLTGHPTGGMMNDGASGGSFVSAHSGAQHPAGMGSGMRSGFAGGMTNALSQGQGGQTGGSGFMSRKSLMSKDDRMPSPNSQLSLSMPLKPSGGGSNALMQMMRGGGEGQDRVGGGLNMARGGENFISAKSNPWHPSGLKKK